MKHTSIIGLLILGLMFQSCKDVKTEQDTLIIEETETVVQQEADTTSYSINTETEETIPATADKTEPVTKTESKPAETTKPVVAATKTTEKEVVKTTTTETTKPVVKEEPVAKEVVVVKEVIKTETKVEPVAEKPVAVAQSTSDWKVPAKYEAMKNPIPAKTDASIGKSLYAKHCQSCHGSQGYGDGTKAKDMKGDLGDFSSAQFQRQSDGALYYKTEVGRNDMPGFSKKLNAEDTWLVVNYMRTLKQ